MATTGKTIAAAGQFTVNFAEAMLKDVTPAMFARQPELGGKKIICNHPAWVYGHNAVYASRMMELMGLPLGVTAKPAGYDDLFKNGTECKDDPTGTIYPKMDELAPYMINAYKAVLAALPTVSDAVFLQPNPGTGRFAEMLPTVGGVVTFLLTGHPMSHLGQVSTWRRCMGLGRAM